MLPKRYFSIILLVAAFFIISGCAATGESKDPSEVSFRSISDECIRWGHRRGSYDYKRCIERKLEAAQKDASHEQD